MSDARLAENWLPVLGFEGLYEISDLGRVRSVDRTVIRRNGYPQPWPGKLRKLVPNVVSGHLAVTLRKDYRTTTRWVHRLVVEAFIGPRRDGMEIRHLDGDPTNNLVSNLAYGSRDENMQDRVRHGTHQMSRRTHCPLDHALTGRNLVPSRLDRGVRECAACAHAHGVVGLRSAPGFRAAADRAYTRFMRPAA